MKNQHKTAIKNHFAEHVIEYAIILLFVFSILAVYLTSLLIPKTTAASSIAFDNPSTSGDVGSTNMLKWQHTTGNGTNMILILGITYFAGVFPSTITYDGVPLTRYVPATASNMAVWDVYIYYLKNPHPGNHTIQIGDNPLPFPNPPPTPFMIVAGAATYSGVDLNNPFGSVGTDTGFLPFTPPMPPPPPTPTPTPIPNTSKINLSTNPGQLVIDVIGFVDFSSWTANQSQRWLQPKNGGSDKLAVGNSTTVGWTLTGGSANYAEVALALNPVPALPTPTPAPIYSITGNVYVDLNNSKVKDGGDGVFGSGTTVALSGDASKTTTTDSSGNYVFDNLYEGNYTVKLTLPPGYSNTTLILQTVTFP
jgi:hypothetical protein